MDGEDQMDLLVAGALSETIHIIPIKRKMHHIKDTKIKQAVLEQFI